jgi:nickel-dependent lactate racemase
MPPLVSKYSIVIISLDKERPTPTKKKLIVMPQVIKDLRSQVNLL